MSQDLFKILKELKQIQPDAEYSRRSRLFIINSKKETEALMRGPILKSKQLTDIFSVFRYSKLALATGLAVILILIAGSIYYVNKELNKNNLVVQASEMNASIQVKLDEIKYLLENKKVNLDAENILAIQAMLDKAVSDLKDISDASVNENGNSPDTLDKIKSAQEIFYQIDTLLKAQN